MVRSMYAGVAGMKANQTRMDVIGNNIANANTYGFKSSRATFRDMYYQQIRGASGGSATRGGTNPSMVGYGSQIASIDLLMTQSSFTSTGNPLDVAIAGEGFLQVMDPDGNIYYTKAGMLDIDPATGALIDSNGNFVLGTSATDGKLDSTEPGSNKILIQVAPVQASVGKVETEISGKKLTITSTNQNKSANVSFTFTKTTELPDGKDVVAIMDGTSSAINIQINANSSFASMADLQKAINNAITEANGGAHAGGDFVFSMQPDPFADGPLTGAQIIDTATADYDGGSIDLVAPGADVSADGSFLGGFKIVETGLRFSGEGDVSVEVTDSADPEGYNVTVTTAGGATYTGFISQERADISSGSGQVLLKNASGDANDTITLSYPNTTDIEANLNNNVTIGTATASQPSKELGWGKGTFTLTGGTEFTEQDVGNLTGISIGADGTIMGTSAAGLQVLGRIDLATFANSEGLMQSGNSYFTATSNSGDAELAIAGENGTGGLRNSALEMSNVDLSQEFSDMITTQRGFQACSRLITVSDTMLEELINLKR
ncbi:MAG TPA: flagellar hook-basal body complex protein [Firmicutes bacterium]|nr:flagellar hook-basal body complex protein [Clostridiales bacterium]HIY80526.1 flagellar hook-basal body complex protein [Bacillota bacterium]